MNSLKPRVAAIEDNLDEAATPKKNEETAASNLKNRAAVGHDLEDNIEKKNEDTTEVNLIHDLKDNIEKEYEETTSPYMKNRAVAGHDLKDDIDKEDEGLISPNMKNRASKIEALGRSSHIQGAELDTTIEQK
jgi:hypothetical protein